MKKHLLDGKDVRLVAYFEKKLKKNCNILKIRKLNCVLRTQYFFIICRINSTRMGIKRDRIEIRSRIKSNIL